MLKKWPLKLGRMFQTAHQNDGFNALRLYLLVPWFQTNKTSQGTMSDHLLELPNRASSHYFQERSSTVTFILKFFCYRIVNLLNISSVSQKFWLFSQTFRRIQCWYRFHLHEARLLAGDFHKFDLWFDFCNAKFHILVWALSDACFDWLVGKMIV